MIRTNSAEICSGQRDNRLNCLNGIVQFALDGAIESPPPTAFSRQFELERGVMEVELECERCGGCQTFLFDGNWQRAIKTSGNTPDIC